MAMCRRLHEDGLLDESLFPRKKTLDAFIDELDCSNSGLPKIGTKRSKSYYEIQSPLELRLMPNYGAQAGSRPLYKIEMKLVQESSYTKIVKQYSVYNPEAYPRKLGLVIGSPLPTGAMHPFDLFTNSGIEIEIAVLIIIILIIVKCSSWLISILLYKILKSVRNHVKLLHLYKSRRGFSKGTVLCGGY